MMKKICFSLILSVTASFLGWADVQYYENSSPLTLKATSGWGINDNFIAVLTSAIMASMWRQAQFP